MGNQNFSLVPRSWQDEKTSFPISLPSSKLTISLISIYKHYAIDIADPSSMPPPPALICKLFFIFTHKAKIKCPRNKYGVVVSLNSILWVRSRVRPQITLSRAENKAVSYCFQGHLILFVQRIFLKSAVLNTVSIVKYMHEH